MGSMTRGYIGYVKRNGVIKCVSIDDDVEIDQVGIELNEYFKDLSDVKELVKSSISYVSEDEVNYTDDLEYLTEDEYEFIEYDNKKDFIDEMEPDTFYYLFENDSWTVAKPNSNEFKELEIVLEEEF